VLNFTETLRMFAKYVVVFIKNFTKVMSYYYSDEIIIILPDLLLLSY